MGRSLSVLDSWVAPVGEGMTTGWKSDEILMQAGPNPKTGAPWLLPLSLAPANSVSFPFLLQCCSLTKSAWLTLSSLCPSKLLCPVEMSWGAWTPSVSLIYGSSSIL